MGGGSSSPDVRGDGAHSPSTTSTTLAVHNLWVSTWRTVDKKSDPRCDHLVTTPGWKTVRLYVSSTFDDFKLEREVLAKKVMPELRIWCQQRCIYFIDCDLKWGVSHDSHTPEFLQTATHEMRRCCKDNPDYTFLLHLSCEKVGWVPGVAEVPEAVRTECSWVDGLSQTEMEVLHMAFRNGSPNALCAIRNPSFIESLPAGTHSAFMEMNEMEKNKMMGLRKALRNRFLKNKFLNYSVNYYGQDPDTKAVLYGDLDAVFAKPVLEHFKSRIEATFPNSATEGVTGTVDAGSIHSLTETASGVLGRAEVITELRNHIAGSSDRLVLIGQRGAGTSAIMARLAQEESSDRNVFYHNVEARLTSTPTPTLLRMLLQDLHKEVDETSTLEELSHIVHETLSTPDVHSILLVIDGIDRLTDDTALSWLPRALPDHVRCVLSTGGVYTPAQDSRGYLHETPPSFVNVLTPILNGEEKRGLIERETAQCGLDLDAMGTDALLNHAGTGNPQWICVACRELTAEGHRVTPKRIEQLPVDLHSLCVCVLDRLEQELGRTLPVAALCLLYLATRGLHEVELLTLLADEQHLLPRKRKEKFQSPRVDDADRLTAPRWAALYRALQYYVREYVAVSGTVRMTLRYTGIGDAIKMRYLCEDEDDEANEGEIPREDTEKIAWWRSRLSVHQHDHP